MYTINIYKEQKIPNICTTNSYNELTETSVCTLKTVMRIKKGVKMWLKT